MKVVELTQETWPLAEALFSTSKTVEWCFCTWFMQTNAEMKVNDNREVLRARLGSPIGLLAVDGAEAVGWVAVAPRASYSRLARSKITAPISDDISGVWSVTCFYVHRSARRQGVTSLLLDAAVDHAAKAGAKSIEGYPIDTEGRKLQAGELYHGRLAMFLDAGFELVERRGTRRALVSRAL
ncbi:acetyltransferase (GNAT) family protein [Lentzea atacamensis]|uniref:Acetyltransferase (GNAT) family protein n=1 Tax=Lentzea atacamensis TaxID=531938 RepID=A0A316HVI6_9PSEU|nr:GNAT family N-acetyltransferase [Lentzea atacamensis]PWK84123.1 acetyltransferase (GNAT) family protein [Lentzea atacamensis]